ncbi:Integral membrane protein [Colletotrichum higginsianum IMI 349063]|uniref:Integral membrane protein n=2 Tax=Colletotrichum higginsianum TaxID=80884 RepID=A0A1B7Y2J7_COLHI|nr:Integral membrane protein [Colletotrichum higginsianum IMI 349063]OBR06228.1 Integral membrane protein [Colletotrichum higginsianum IMI 349063]TIC96870.1 hypothetical protein CH35J_007180 [Colletotrichum higginsianum]
MSALEAEKDGGSRSSDDFEHMKDQIISDMEMAFGSEAHEGPDSKLKAKVVLRLLQTLGNKDLKQEDLLDMLRHPSYQKSPAVASPYLDDAPDSAERKEILTWLKTTKFAYRHNGPLELLNPTIFTPLVWSAFAIAPMEQLREFRLHETSSIPAMMGFLQGCLPALMNIFLARNPKTGRKKDLDRDNYENIGNKSRRLQGYRKLASERDKNACVLTSAPFPRVCHIIPYSAQMYMQQVETALNSLAFIWGSQVENPIDLLDHEGYEHPRNMISLSCEFHRLWSRAMVALEPVEVARDGTWIIVQVRWMHGSKLDRRRLDKTSREVKQVDIDMDVKDILQPLANEHNVPIRIIDLETQRYIKDGHKFKIKSEDPAFLPSEDLLRLQYNLCRMAALTGAACRDDDLDFDTDLASEQPPSVEAWIEAVENAKKSGEMLDEE